jgi:hypothetical protein
MCNFYVTKYIIMEQCCIAHASFILQPLALSHNILYMYISSVMLLTLNIV